MSLNINLADEIAKICNEYTDEVSKAVKETAIEVAKEAVVALKANSPRKNGGTERYAKNWKAKNESSSALLSSVIIHNATDYQLTHLLENGHLIKNKYGAFGRTKPIPHIAPVEEFYSDVFVAKTIARLKK